MIFAVTIMLSLLYAILLILLLVGFSRTAGRLKSSAKADGVSVIVAFRNEAANLQRLIDSFNAQVLPCEFWEVIFVDDNSTDGSSDLVSSASKSFNFSLITLSGIEGKKPAIIEGVKIANFNLIAITDADCIVSATWLSDLVEHGDLALVQRPVIVDAQSSAVNMFEALDYASLMATSVGSFGLGRPVIAASANLAFRKDLVDVNSESLRADISSGDDMFLLHSAKRKKGNRLSFDLSRKGFVSTRFDGGFAGFIRRRKRWASKASGYKDIDTIVVASAVLLLNLWIVCLLVLHLLGYSSIYNLLIAWLVKTAVDFLLLFVYLKRTNQLKLMLVFLPLQLIYPIYISYSAIAGLLGGQIWKGRQIN
ncbi:glycosyl transferase [Tenuifilaceae bacterium CYCD]|nr:glycosyl transferase [Tenuifilaceae bacterium CYCD]